MNNAPKPSFWALSPLFVFLAVYLVTSIIVNDFYKVPITVAFIISSIVSIAMTKKLSLSKRISHFSTGAANKNVMLMIWVFILAGAFAQTTKSIGAIDATVNLTLYVLPENFVLAGVFVAACFVSFSVGTSVGTIVSLLPVAVGLSAKTGVDLPMMVGIVVGGAFFGDNLSFISDTTIAATKTQGCEMRDKFKVNIMIVLPCAILLLIYYIIAGFNLDPQIEKLNSVDWIRVLPYILVLGSAMAGMNVLLVLFLGILSSTIIGLCYVNMSIFDLFGYMGEGINGMGELIIITLLAGGMLEMIRYNGGITFIIEKLTNRVNGKKGAELSIAGLVCMANLCTANNTIAVITIGPIAKNISDKFGIDPRKSASILDTFSCFIQGIIPYGAQILIAAELAGISPIEIIEHLYYPILIGASALVAILFNYPRKYSA